MGSDDYKDQLPSLVANGSVSQQTLNTAVKNVLRTKIVSGMLDFYPSGNNSFVNSTEHQQIAREGARKSVILLKNSDDILPLKKNIKVTYWSQCRSVKSQLFRQ
jgi:beta-glucosidase